VAAEDQIGVKLLIFQFKFVYLFKIMLNLVHN